MHATGRFAAHDHRTGRPPQRPARRFQFGGRALEADAVLVFRVADGRIAEVRDLATPVDILADELGAALTTHLAAVDNS